jgi:SpoVK/Ycf46/Vps4 family AAA+-type ATPase
MDGVESRGQIMIIGATNRPDQIDPAFRRPGRFDREVRLSLPTEDARREILDVHTRHWTHQPSDELKNIIAKETAGYAGADLAVLCNEANVISLKRKYPQIWLTDKKLKVDMKNLTVVAADFQLAMRKITPSSRREASVQQGALPGRIEPLLQVQFKSLTERMERSMPTHKRKKMTDLEEILHAHPDPEVEHRREERRRGFETSRVYRPRLLITSAPGNGLDYTANALIHHLENHYTRAIDFNSLSSDSSQSLAASLGMVLKEVRRNQPSILYIPSVDEWFQSMPGDVVHILARFLRSLPASDQIMVLGTLDADLADLDLPVQSWIKMTFGVTSKNRFTLATPDSEGRFKYLQSLVDMIKNRPSELTEKRKKRKLESLPVAPILPAEGPKLTKAELKAQREQDEITLSLLRSHLRVILNQVMAPYATLRASVIDDRSIEYLLQETDPQFVASDVPLEPAARPYEVTTDKHGNRMLLETQSGAKFYNCNLGVISERVANGYYKRPDEFVWDVKTILKDREMDGDEEAIKKATDMYGSIRAEVLLVKSTYRDLMEACEGVYKRELQRKKVLDEKNKASADAGFTFANVPRPAPESTVLEGPIAFGNLQSRPELPPPHTPVRPGSRGNAEAKTNGMSNGDHHETGSNEAVAEVTMTSNGVVDIDTSGSRPQFPAGYTATPSNPTTTQHQSTQGGIPTQVTLTQQSQQSAIQRIAPGTQAEDYANDASTTDSAQRTTSQRTSDIIPHPIPFAGTAGSSNGNGMLKKRRRSDEEDDAPLTTWASMVPPSDSQLPDTQSDLASKRASTNNTDPAMGEFAWGRVPTQESPVTNGTQHSQGFVKPALPSHAASALDAPPAAKKLRVSQESDEEDSMMDADHLYVCDMVALEALHRKFVKESEGWTVDELEMFDGEGMNVIWDTRENWNRDEVMKDVEAAFYECMEQVKVNREFEKMRQNVGGD